jgi:hypothetical protein
MRLKKIAALTVVASVLFSGTCLAAGKNNQQAGNGNQNNQEVTVEEIGRGSFNIPAGGDLKFSDTTYDVDAEASRVAFLVQNDEDSATAIKVKISRQGQVLEESEIAPNHGGISNLFPPGSVYRVEMERVNDSPCSGVMSLLRQIQQ